MEGGCSLLYRCQSVVGVARCLVQLTMTLGNNVSLGVPWQ